MKESDAILFSCIGGADHKASKDNFPADNSGAIVKALRETQYSKVILFSDRKEEDERFCQALRDFIAKEKKHTEVALEYRIIKNPMDRSSIYSIMQELVTQHSPSHTARTYLLSSGTSAMHLCWTLLAHTDKHHARLIDASREQGITEVPHWIELSHAFLPTIPNRTSELIEKIGEAITTEDIIGENKSLNKAKGLAMMAAKAHRDDYSVIIFGETGTGKESIAQLIHNESKDSEKGKFLAINCGAMPEELLESELFGHKKGAFTGAYQDKKGLFECAGDGGTLFLDELGEMPATLQTKLLRVLQERKIRPVGSPDEVSIKNVRIIAATHKSLAKGVAEGWFRADLYYRLNVIEIHLPPLRKRLDDLKKLSKHLLNHINEKLLENNLKATELSDDAFQALLNHSWPGNIRELQNTLRRAALFVQQEQKPTINALLLHELILPAIHTNNDHDWANRESNANGSELAHLFNEIHHHYYLRLFNENPSISRGEVAKRLNITDPTLRKKEDDWKAMGWKVFPRQIRKQKNTNVT